MLVVDLRISPQSEYTPHGFAFPVLEGATRAKYQSPPSILPKELIPTTWSFTRIFDTLSKYPSHIFLNRSRISFSMSSSSSLTTTFTDVAFCWASAEIELSPFAVVTWPVTAVELIPRYGRLYDLRNVVRRGRDDNEGSCESYHPGSMIQSDHQIPPLNNMYSPGP